LTASKAGACPWGEDGDFCKHCVAVGVVYLYERDHGGDIPEPIDLGSYLNSLDRAELVDLLLEATEEDAALREGLERRAAFAHCSQTPLAAVRRRSGISTST
jgi:uncharacterized Zn finger protein